MNKIHSKCKRSFSRSHIIKAKKKKKKDRKVDVCPWEAGVYGYFILYGEGESDVRI